MMDTGSQYTPIGFSVFALRTVDRTHAGPICGTGVGRETCAVKTRAACAQRLCLFRVAFGFGSRAHG